MRTILRPLLVAPAAALGAAAAFTLPVHAERPSAQPVAQVQSASDFEAVQRHVDAYRSGDIDQFVATFSPDAVVRADGFVAMGRAQIRALYELNFEPGAPQLRIHESYQSDGKIVLRIGYVMPDGQEFCCSVSEYEVTDGKVSALRTGT
ncbi:MAG: nuclear transport factor 2 family protein [Pseudomonadota bacterium]